MKERNMDEYIVLCLGHSIELKPDSLHYNYKDLAAWIDKDNKYSCREALEYFDFLNEKVDISGMSKGATLIRLIKFSIFYKLSYGTRVQIYYKHYWNKGFLDGKEDKMFAFFQVYWYQYLVDAKIYQFRMRNIYSIINKSLDNRREVIRKIASCVVSMMEVAYA